MEPPTVENVEAILRTHVFDVWFPRSLDLEHGGFLCDFDRRWNECGPHEKLLEFQARHTLFAAEALARFPGEERLERAMRHGDEYLGGVMWDAEAGGWFHRVDRGGQPLEARTKHAHGIAYGIHASAAVYEATKEPRALDRAREGFEWLEQHAHDAENGGYFGFLTREGKVIREAGDCPWETAVDTIETPIGFKDLNIHSDLLEAFTFLYEVAPTAMLQERIGEIVRIVCARAVMPSGALAYFFRPDWTPIPHLVRIGNGFQTTYRLVRAGKMLGMEEEVGRVARGILRYALEFGRDAGEGGFFYAAPAVAPVWVEGHSLVARRKSWWVQAEALRALLTMMRMDGEDAAYARYFAEQWNFMRRQMLDARYGGMFAAGADHLPRWRRRLGASFAPPGVTRKGNEWKDASHDGRAWLDALAFFQSGEAQAVGAR